MNTIDLGRIIEERQLDKKEVAKQLFPTHNYPALALNRIIKGEAALDADQISKLSVMLDIPISELFGEGWKSNSPEKDLVVFTNGQYVARLNLKEMKSEVYHKNSLLHESIYHNSTIKLSEYLTEINSIINNHKNQK